MYACTLLLYCKALLILLMTFHSNSTYFTHGLSIIIFFLCTSCNSMYKSFIYGEGDLSFWTCAQSQLLYVAINICSNHFTLPKIIHEIMRLIILIKLCIFLVTCRVKYRRYTMVIRGYIHDIHNGVHNSCRTNHRQLLFRWHVNDDSKYYVHIESDIRKLNI